MELHHSFADLLDVFRQSGGKHPSELRAELTRCNIPRELKMVIREAIQGDNRPLNVWLFSDQHAEDQTLAWIAPIKANRPEYVWMIGHQNTLSLTVHYWFQSIRPYTQSDSLLRQRLVTPRLLFVDTYEVSRNTFRSTGNADEFAIFQVGYRNAPVEVSDLEQRMVINATYAAHKRKEALDRLAILQQENGSTLATDLLSYLNLFAVLHNEGHNQGHFVGAWPFEDIIKKNCLLYESIEEFKACLASIVFATHLPLSSRERELFAVSVFVTRFLGFGFDAFCRPQQRRETAREITVGLLFFEWLRHENAIHVVGNGSIAFKPSEIYHSLLRAYTVIFEEESRVVTKSPEALKSIARKWYALAFPDGDYTHTAKTVYNRLRVAR